MLRRPHHMKAFSRRLTSKMKVVLPLLFFLLAFATSGFANAQVGYFCPSPIRVKLV